MTEFNVYCTRCEETLMVEPDDEVTEFATIGDEQDRIHGDLCVSCTTEFYLFLDQQLVS